MLSRGFKPFDPLWLAKATEDIVCSGDARKYTAFYATGVYGGIATGYAVGCCFRCFFCWSDWSRDFPELYGEYYTCEEAYRILLRLLEDGMLGGLGLALVNQHFVETI